MTDIELDTPVERLLRGGATAALICLALTLLTLGFLLDRPLSAATPEYSGANLALTTNNADELSARSNP